MSGFSTMPSAWRRAEIRFFVVLGSMLISLRLWALHRLRLDLCRSHSTRSQGQVLALRVPLKACDKDVMTGKSGAHTGLAASVLYCFASSLHGVSRLTGR